MSGTSLSERISWAEANLQRQLDWVSRHDTRIATIFGICIAMLGFLATEAPDLSKISAGAAFFSVVTIAVLAVCLIAIYFSHYPRTTSPNSSLVFFDTISSLTKDEFSDSFCTRTEREHLEDLCAQAHINSVIISKKFALLKVAMIFLLSSTPTWVASIVLLKLDSGA